MTNSICVNLTVKIAVLQNHHWGRTRSKQFCRSNLIAKGGSYQGRHGRAPFFKKIIVFSEILMLRRKILRLLLLVKTKIKVLNLIGKSLDLAPLLYRCHDASGTFCTSNCVRNLQVDPPSFMRNWECCSVKCVFSILLVYNSRQLFKLKVVFNHISRIISKTIAKLGKLCLSQSKSRGLSSRTPSLLHNLVDVRLLLRLLSTSGVYIRSLKGGRCESKEA